MTRTANPSMSKSLGRAHKIIRQLEEAGMTDADWNKLQDDPELRRRVVELCLSSTYVGLPHELPELHSEFLLDAVFALSGRFRYDPKRKSLRTLCEGMDPKLLDILVHAYFMERSDGSVGWYTDQIAERHRIPYDQVQDSIRRAKSYIRDQNMKDYKERLKTYSGEALLAESVDLLDLSEGARNGLMLVGITTIRQLTETTKDQLFHHRFMKKERIEEIKEKLAVYGLSLKQ